MSGMNHSFIPFNIFIISIVKKLQPDSKPVVNQDIFKTEEIL